jgi:peptidyl-prolyl cis-trans isomerase D
MAALGKIRNKGVTLVIIIALGLFAFIAEEAFRSCNGIKSQQSMQIGEVAGEKISVQDYQKLLDEYQNVVKFTSQRDNLTEDELNQIKDQVWQQYITNKVIAADAAKLGLTVTEEELQNVINQGTNQLLTQTPFVNQQTGRSDVNTLKQFIDQYKKAQKENAQQAEQMQMVYDYWMFVEKNLRTQLLGQKYQTLLAHCVLSNKVEAKMGFKDQNEEAQILLASLAYSSLKDADVKVDDADLNAKYAELKPAFKQASETRDIKYVDFVIT